MGTGWFLSPLIYCVTLAKALSLSGLRFSHLQNETEHPVCITRRKVPSEASLGRALETGLPPPVLLPSPGNQAGRSAEDGWVPLSALGLNLEAPPRTRQSYSLEMAALSFKSGLESEQPCAALSSSPARLPPSP